MSKRRVQIVNFGATHSGLSTVGYTIYNSDGSVYQARVADVVEYGPSTGVYGSMVNIPDTTEIVILWDTGIAPIRYAATEGMSGINAIQESTDWIRVIWNSLKNNGELYSRLLDKLRLLEDRSGLASEKSLQDIKDIVGSLSKKHDSTILQIESLSNSEKSSGKDYSESLGAIKDEIFALKASMASLNGILNGADASKNVVLSELSKMESSLKIAQDISSRQTKESIFKILDEIGKTKQRVDMIGSGVSATVKTVNSSINNDFIRNSKTLEGKVNGEIKFLSSEIRSAIEDLYKRIDPTHMIMVIASTLRQYEKEQANLEHGSKIRKMLG